VIKLQSLDRDTVRKLSIMRSISLVFCHDQGISHLESWIVFLTTPLQTKLYCQIPVLVTTVESPYDINRVIRAYLLKVLVSSSIGVRCD